MKKTYKAQDVNISWVGSRIGDYSSESEIRAPAFTLRDCSDYPEGHPLF